MKNKVVFFVLEVVAAFIIVELILLPLKAEFKKKIEEHNKK